MHFELALFTKLGEAHAEQRKVAGEPIPVVRMPKGRAQVALHRFMVLFTK